MQNRDDSAAFQGEVREQVLGAPDTIRGLVTIWVSVSLSPGYLGQIFAGCVMSTGELGAGAP